jgi:hypothetical protein
MLRQRDSRLAGWKDWNMNDKTLASNAGLQSGLRSSRESGSIADARKHSINTAEPAQPTNAYTPRPYSIHYDRDGCDEFFRIADIHGSILASVFFWGEVPGDRERALANARLFASAPELLATLQELLVVMGRLVSPDLPAEFYAAESKAMAVVAEAEGRR